MGRRKSEFPQGYFLLKNKPNGKDEQKLYLQYIVNGVKASISTGWNS